MKKLYWLPVLLPLLAGCGGDDRSMEELQDRYRELTGQELDAPMRWAADDLENIGDWEYRVLDISEMSADDLQLSLNTLGDDRWELIWMDRTLSGHRLILKRPALSVLSKLPLSELRRLLPDGEGGP